MGVESRYGLTFGYMEHGQRNLITDVPGVRVGQVTLHGGEVHTGVTAIIPHTGDVFHEKCLAGAHVINGFGKSIGLVQVQELGTLETPILLTNTLSVGTVSTALVEYMLERNDDIGLDAGTVNSLVMECNDARLSDIRGLHVTKEHARAALAAASETFAEGDVGAGAGMVCYSLKVGIGSASRLCHLYGETYTVGALVMTNFGTLRDLKVAGDSVGERLFWQEQSELKDKGSIIVIIATDVPLSARQLERVAKRAQSGIARTGGMGPLATADLFEKIIRATDAARDQDFPHVIVDCNTDIPDRTAAILMGGEDPVPQLVRSANTLAAAGADVLIMPCNTARWFYDDLCLRTHLPVLHMLRLTADHLERTGVNAVGLLATDGTIQTGIYENLLSGRGIRVIKPDAPGQRRVMSAIYDGVKAGNLGAIDVAALRYTLDAMIAQGAECFVLGCAELPIVFAQCELPYPVADPTQILAEAAVSFAGYPVKKM